MHLSYPVVRLIAISSAICAAFPTALLTADWVKLNLRPTSVPFVFKCLTAKYAATLRALTFVGSLLDGIIDFGVSAKISATRSITVSKV
jgi:hypothetical protein